MASKILGQAAPAATTDTDLYVVPAFMQATSSTLAVCNRSGSAVAYRVATRPAGAAIAPQHYIAYGTELAANSSDYYTIGMTLAAAPLMRYTDATAAQLLHPSEYVQQLRATAPEIRQP